MTRKLTVAPGRGAAERAECCAATRPALKDRPLLSFVEAVKVMALFKVLANDTRIRLLHHLVRSGEATVTDMAKTLGHEAAGGLEPARAAVGHRDARVPAGREQRVLPGRERVRRRRSSTWPSASWRTRAVPRDRTGG